jgi:hypothetical protein
MLDRWVVKSPLNGLGLHNLHLLNPLNLSNRLKLNLLKPNLALSLSPRLNPLNYFSRQNCRSLNQFPPRLLFQLTRLKQVPPGHLFVPLLS